MIELHRFSAELRRDWATDEAPRGRVPLRPTVRRAAEVAQLLLVVAGAVEARELASVVTCAMQITNSANTHTTHAERGSR
jgi:hypothetical protein